MIPLIHRTGWLRGIPAFTLWVAASAAHSQGTAPRAERADPLDARSPVPAVVHRSALAGYVRLGEDRRVPWQEANETVNRIGGWKTYLREAQQPDPVSTPDKPVRPAAVPASAPAADHTHKH